jgi:hypothetical protein
LLHQGSSPLAASLSTKNFPQTKIRLLFTEQFAL